MIQCFEMFTEFSGLAIGHFPAHFIVYFKANLRANSLLSILVFIHIEIRTNCHNKNFAPRLVLKERLWEARKWSIAADLERINTYGS